MKSILKFTILLLLQIFLINLCFAESNIDIANKYYDENNYSSAKSYLEESLFNDGIANGTLFYRLGYSYEQLSLPKSTYSKLYCAAAYCFERDNDKDNKYYSYAITKEKDLNVNHKNYTEETIQKLIDDLYWENHKKDFSYYKNHITQLLCLVILILILVTTITVFIFKLIRHYTRYSINFPQIEYPLSSLFNGSNFIDSDNEFNNLLQETYNSMVKKARSQSTRIHCPEDYLLYKFGQVIFTKNGNSIDDKTVTKGLKQIFFEDNPTIETTKQKITFINIFKELFDNWDKIQRRYWDRLYEIPEFGMLLTVLSTKMTDDDFVYNANLVVEFTNKYEKIDCKSYRKDLLVIANKLYHEKCNENDLSQKLEHELKKIDKRFFNVMKLFFGKLCLLISKILPIFLFAYVLSFVVLTSSITFGKVIITGICCFLLYKLKDNHLDLFFEYKSFSKFKTKAEQDFERQFQAAANAAAKNSRNTSSEPQSSYSNQDYEDDDVTYVENTTQTEQHQKTQIKKYYCKYCGLSERDMFNLTHGYCKENPHGKNHSPYQGETTGPYYCEYCGYKENNLFTLTHGYCKENPTGRDKHSPYEGTNSNKYYCEYCGHGERDLFTLTHGYCKNSPYKKHHPAR